MAKSNVISILNGPNLGRLGMREPEIYGSVTLADIEKRCRECAQRENLDVHFFQSDAEHEIVGAIHRATDEDHAAILINAGAFTHTSIAMRDAIAMFDGIKIEIHLSNIYAREDFRHYSFIADLATGVICGFGALSYVSAISITAGLLKGDEQ